jgi:hypothetical protein
VQLRRIGLALAAAAALAGCKSAWQVDTAQPRMHLGIEPLSRQSSTQSIALADMHLPPRFKLPNEAQIVLVTRDRLRAHVRLVHRWKDMTDLDRWKAWLEDDRGRKLYPSAVDKRHTGHINEIVVPDLDHFARATGFVYRVPVNLYDGGGDYDFYAPGFYHERIRRLTLVLERRGYQFRYTWHFVRDQSAITTR